MIKFDHETELVRVNFIHVEKQQATIAVFKSFDDVFESKQALFYHTVDIATQTSIDSYASDELTDDVKSHLINCFNTKYVFEDCIYEMSEAHKNDIKLETHNTFDMSVFYHEFLISDLDVNYLK
ncbi:hypothetical protein KI655_18685 [Vibrio sp. D404a]|uniref:hypothetical protein n=1 Tax=unclassified Vibrio TaxID=2614977 RepID=UPI0025526097|nr:MULTISPECIES: hypothetical protein [unclassified Vibrio]MDK9739326.1 hypothetical protein [Vibrio sp. D404a]MDK9797639.1 hypothetical protein [Vibrio sp. D449a]